MGEIKTLADLKPDQKNARKHNPRNIGMISKAIGEVGVARSIVIDEEGNILAGNGTVEALAECGIMDVRVIEANGNELIAVQRKGLSEEQKKKLALYDNRTAELADWDSQILIEINTEMPDVLENMFTPLELDELLDLSTGVGFQEGEDDAPEAPEEPVTKLGDLYQLGEHRLLCGDSTDKVTVDILMDGQKADMVFTDPPYGMNLDTDYSSIKGTSDLAKTLTPKAHRKVIGDDFDFDPSFLLELFNKTKEIFLWGADYYCQRLPSGGSWVVWDKTGGHDSLMNAGFGSNFELCWSKQKHKRDIARFTWKGVAGRAGEKTVHPTQKPIKMAEWFFEKWGNENDVVLDLFGGSGSTLIACEKLDRKCYMMEIDPAYCDVIVTRWEEFTGKKAELIQKELING